MDGGGRRAYVRGVNLLLLLSALLTALTGVGGATRAPQVAQAVAGPAECAAVADARAAVVAVRPRQALPSLRAVATAISAALALPAGEPIWASRRRE